LYVECTRINNALTSDMCNWKTGPAPRSPSRFQIRHWVDCGVLRLYEEITNSFIKWRITRLVVYRSPANENILRTRRPYCPAFCTRTHARIVTSIVTARICSLKFPAGRVFFPNPRPSDRLFNTIYISVFTERNKLKIIIIILLL